MNLSFQSIPHPDKYFPSLFLDYIGEKAPLLECFCDSPHRIQKLDIQHFRRSLQLPREKLCELLSQYQEKIGVQNEIVYKHIEDLRDNNTYAVVTGQQPALFSGPLYTIYKILTVIQLTRKLNAIGIGRFVPVFWNASEDHDLAEANRLTIINREGELETLRADFQDELKPLETLLSSVSSAVRLFDTLAISEFTNAVKELAAVPAALSFAEGISLLLSRLFAPYGLITVEPKIFRKYAGPFFAQALSTSGVVGQTIERAQESLSRLGYEPSVPELAPPFLFDLSGGRRERLIEAGDRIRLKKTAKNYSRDQIKKTVTQHPENYSPDVLLRPIFQDSFLPTVIYVAGPSEVGYLALLKQVYKHFSIPMPYVYPRGSFTLVEEKLERGGQRFGTTIEQVLATGEVAVNASENKVVQTLAIQSTTEEILGHLDVLRRETAKFAALKRPFERGTRRIQTELDRLMKRVKEAELETRGIGTRQRQQILHHLLPQGKLQERILNVFMFLNRHGPEFLHRLIEEWDGNVFQHTIVSIK